METYARLKSGRAWNGAQRDAGQIYHAVPDKNFPSWGKALCGITPGVRGNGWQSYEERRDIVVTCSRCQKKLLKVN